jgi:AcrR family transcriptional regulator
LKRLLAFWNQTDFVGFNTNAIAAKAGVSIGSVYQYFPHKDSIVRALINGYEEMFHDTVVKAVQGQPLPNCANPANCQGKRAFEYGTRVSRSNGVGRLNAEMPVYGE